MAKSKTSQPVKQYTGSSKTGFTVTIKSWIDSGAKK